MPVSDKHTNIAAAAQSHLPTSTAQLFRERLLIASDWLLMFDGDHACGSLMCVSPGVIQSARWHLFVGLG